MARRAWRRTPRSSRFEQQGPTLSGRGVRGAGEDARSKSWLGSLLLLALSLLFIGRFVGNDSFAVTQVDIQGASLVPVEEIEAYADALGKPIFLLNTRQSEARILSALGCLQRARVRARLPNRVEIQVSEKAALLLWENQGRYWWVDAHGRVLGAARNRGELPAVHDRRTLEEEPGEYIVGVPWAYAAEMSQALAGVRDFDFTLEDGLIVISPEGWPVYLGMGGNASQKVLLLQQLTATLAARGDRVIFIDLKNERRPAVKLEIG